MHLYTIYVSINDMNTDVTNSILMNLEDPGEIAVLSIGVRITFFTLLNIYKST